MSVQEKACYVIIEYFLYRIDPDSDFDFDFDFRILQLHDILI